MNQQATELAIQYGAYLISQVSRQQIEQIDATFDWSIWTSKLFDRTRTPRNALLAIWSLVVAEGAAPPPSRIPTVLVNLAARRMGDHPKGPGDATEGSGQSVWLMNPVLNTVDPNPEGFSAAVSALGKAFIEQGGATETNFDRFFFLMQKYASTLPCTYGEPGVSLFQQWRMVAAVMALSTDGTPDTLPQDLALIGLDLPGIQETVYTITSRGAAKSVRGRSAFIQLLVNALVDRIVRDLGLCRANVIVNAGGNALILAGGTAQIEAYLQEVYREISHLLLHGNDAREFAGFQGDLALALAWSKVPWSALRFAQGEPLKKQDETGNYVSEWQFYEKQLKQQLQQAKHRPFAALLSTEAGFKLVFQPEQIDSNRHCAVCRRPEYKRLVEFEPCAAEEPEVAGTAQVCCPMCQSFRKLADSLAKNGAILNRAVAPTGKPEIWQIGLHAASGYWYSVNDHGRPDVLSLALSPENFPAGNIDGFWPLATTTPRVTADDVKCLRRQGNEQTDEGDIRDNLLLAEESAGTFKRLGVLKADVDDLGKVLVTGLGERRSAALTATLSESLTLFFGGWLDKICAEEPFRNKIYVLYAGGDDLLIIGTWDVMPLLAQRIAENFRRYTGENPGVHLSAGISITGGKEPFHAAREAADKALKKAKRYPSKQRREKNAINFIGKVLAWEDFADVVRWQEELRSLVEGGAPKALLMTLLQIYAQYQDDLPDNANRVSGYATRGTFGTYNGNSLYLGPWLWQMVYRLHRLTNPALTQEKVQEIQRALLQTQQEDRPGGVDKMAVSARWAQLVSRKKEEE